MGNKGHFCGTRTYKGCHKPFKFCSFKTEMLQTKLKDTFIVTIKFPSEATVAQSVLTKVQFLAGAKHYFL
jgi:hypothetical protein